jgi:voltage-dependent potassium channel beta subunit
MEYRLLGKSGLEVSALSFGSWLTFGKQIDKRVAQDCILAAREGGINFFDNAESYAQGKSEEVMGELIAQAGWARDSYVISSKVFWGGEQPNQIGLSRKHVTEACHAALKRLRVDYLDLYFCHRPDRKTPMEETVWAMHNLITQGKVLYWGTSEWSAQEIMEAHMIARQHHLIPPLMEQPQYNMFARERVEKEYAKLYDVVGLGTTIWSPLASGLLTGKYNEGIPEDSRAQSHPDLPWLHDIFTNEKAQSVIAATRKLQPLAEELSCSLAQLALAWCLKNPHVSSVILGASRVAQVQENLKAVEVYKKLTSEYMERIEGILANKPAIPEFR